MTLGVQPVPRHRRFHSGNVEETRAYFQEAQFQLDLSAREARTFDFTAHGLYLPGTYIGFVKYGAAATTVVSPERKRADYWIHLPVTGNFEVSTGAGSVDCLPVRGSIVSPLGHVTRAAAGSERITLSIPSASLMSQLAALLGEPSARFLEFDQALDLTSAYGQRLTRQVELVLADFRDPKLARNPLLESMYEQMLLTGLLMSHPHNLLERLNGLDFRLLPRDVKRAIDYMQANLDCPVTLADLVRISGVPGSTLLKHFKDHWGLSPLQYLRNARFARVREALTRASPEESVTDVALKWGFQHLGRFSVEYRRRFGETPSDTRKRATMHSSR